MGSRGEGWVVIQVILFGLFLFAPRIGSDWPDVFVLDIVGWLLIVAGGLLLLWSARSLGRSLTPFPRPLPHAHLVTEGAYRVVRHPIYSAVIIGAIGVSLVSQHWIRLLLSGVLLIFFDLKARREEQWLTQQYPDYAAYRSRVKKLLPCIY